jgi:hypothetical protein
LTPSWPCEAIPPCPVGAALDATLAEQSEWREV